MNLLLTSLEIRVLGCLIEKEITTPDYYPMTINALKNACNQKSNRDPVMSVEENPVLDAMNSLIRKHVTWLKPTPDSRVPKYAHRLTTLFPFSPAELAILCELFLRGPQTQGELRTHAQRMHPFADLGEVEAVLQHLMEEDFGPFVVKLPTEPGRREHRYAHLFAGKDAIETSRADTVATESSTPTRASDNSLKQMVEELRDKINALEERVAQLESRGG